MRELISIGDKVRVIQLQDANDEYEVGDEFTISEVHEFSDGNHVYEEGGGLQFYSSELELIEEPAEFTDMPAVEAEPRNLGEFIPLGTDAPYVNLEPESELAKEMRGFGESEVNGILQAGISIEQATAAMTRAKQTARIKAVADAQKALEEAQARLEEVQPLTAEGNVITGTLMSFPVAPDNVNQPNHYTQGKFETIEIIEHTTSGYSDGFTAHCVGTATKYLNRAPFKHENPLEDIRKAMKYLEFAAKHEEEKL